MKRIVLVTALAAAVIGGVSAPAVAQTPGWARAGSTSAAAGQVTAAGWQLQGTYPSKGFCEEKGKHFVNLWKISGGKEGFKDYFCSLANAGTNEWFLFVLG